MRIALGFAVGLAGVPPQSSVWSCDLNLVNTSQLSLLNLASAGGSFKERGTYRSFHKSNILVPSWVMWLVRWVEALPLMVGF
jgi:hypothetical protein